LLFQIAAVPAVDARNTSKNNAEVFRPAIEASCPPLLRQEWRRSRARNVMGITIPPIAMAAK
jgi:hypothetical protein